MNKKIFWSIILAIGILLFFLPGTTFLISLKIIFVAGLIFYLWSTGEIQPLFQQFLSNPEAQVNPAEMKRESQESETGVRIETDFEKYVQSLIQTIKGISGADSVFLYFYNQYKDHFKLKAHLTDHHQQVRLSEYLPSQSGIFPVVLQEKKNIIEKDIELSPRYLPYYSSTIASRGTILIFPFYYANHLAGIFCIDKNGAESIEQTVIIRIEKLVRNFEIFFRFSSQLFDLQIRHKLEESYIEIANTFNPLSSSAELWESVEKFLHRLFSFDRAMIVLLQSHDEASDPYLLIHQVLGDSGGFVPGMQFPMSEGTIQWVISQKQTIRIHDLHQRDKKLYRFEPDEKNHLPSRSLLIAPIISTRESFGAIVLESLEPYSYGDIEKNLLQFLGSQLGHSLQRIMNYERLLVTRAKDPEFNVWTETAFQERLEEEIARAKRFQQIFSLVYLQFEFTPQTGDFHETDPKVLLKPMIHLIKNSSRKIDFIALLPHGKLAILLVQTSASGAQEYLKRIFLQIQNIIQQELFIHFQVDVFGGITSFPETGPTSQEILRRLEHALTISREKGPFSFQYVGDINGNQ